MDKKNLAIAAIAIIAIVAAAAITNAQLASSKSAVVEESARLWSGSTNVEEMGSVMIKTPNMKDLVISVSAEAILFTDTRVKGNKDAASTSDMDTASIQVWAELDGNGTPGTGVEAKPGRITFAERIQTMEGILSNVVTYECIDPITGEPTGELCFEDVPEEVRLMLNTTSANSFDFILLDVPQGEHTITVWAQLSADESGSFINDSPYASIGARTIVVQEIRLTQGAEI